MRIKITSGPSYDPPRQKVTGIFLPSQRKTTEKRRFSAFRWHLQGLYKFLIKRFIVLFEPQSAARWHRHQKCSQYISLERFGVGNKFLISREQKAPPAISRGIKSFSKLLIKK
jgi:hypothetical protein